MKYDMVFDGGGAKGMVFVGALQEVEMRGHAPARLMGTSAGAIMATFLAAGFTSREMQDALSEKVKGKPVFQGFLEEPPLMNELQIKGGVFYKLLRSSNDPLIPDFVERWIDDELINVLAKFPPLNKALFFFEYGGLHARQYFLKWLEEKLNEGVYNVDRGEFGKGRQRCFGNMNLLQYYQATGMNLSLIASDTTDAKLIVLNHRTAPTCPLIYAVAMSMSFPFLWQEVIWDAEWGDYCGQEISGHTIIDGGMVSHFPIELLISNEPQITEIMGEKAVGTAQALGFLIDDAMEVPGTQTPNKDPGIPDTNLGGEIQLKFVERIGNLINTMTRSHDKIIVDEFESFIIHLPAKGYKTTDFDMGDARRNALIQAGQNAASKYFDSNEMTWPKTPSSDQDDSSVYRSTCCEIADHLAKSLLGL